MMERKTLLAFMESLKDPFVFADTRRIVRYMNRAAIAHYKEGASLLGGSLFDCHNEQSCRMMEEILAAFHAGEDERMIRDDEKYRIYMRVVRDERGEVIGYYERYEPPVKKSK